MADDKDILRWPVRTAEWLHFQVTTSVDPLTDPIKAALIEHRTEPNNGDFRTAEWIAGQTWTSGTPVKGRVWMPANTLQVGQKYDLIVQVTDNPEIVEMNAGIVQGAVS
jgi:hypothetical protein